MFTINGHGLPKRYTDHVHHFEASSRVQVAGFVVLGSDAKKDVLKQFRCLGMAVSGVWVWFCEKFYFGYLLLSIFFMDCFLF